MQYNEIRSCYEECNYNKIISVENAILESCDPKTMFYLIKSIIHISWENDPRVKRYLFIAIFSENKISFRWSFSIEFLADKNIPNLFSIMDSYDGFTQYIHTSASIEQIQYRCSMHLDVLKDPQNNLEKFLIFIFYWLELYDLDYEEYPMIKWLLHHFYKHN